MLFLGCFTLMGCPSEHYYRYKYVGEDSLGTDREFTLLKFNEVTDIGITCGFYYQFTGEKEKGLATRIVIKRNEKFEVLKTKVKVTSSKLGALKQRQIPNGSHPDALPALLFDKQIDVKQERKILKRIENDTITIAFANGMTYPFVKR